MVLQVPTVEKVFYFFPLHPFALVYGWIKLAVSTLITIMYLTIFFTSKNLQEEALAIAIIIHIVLMLDLVTISYFLIGYVTKNVKYLTMYYTFCVYTFLIKTVVVILLCFFAQFNLILPYFICTIMDIYLIVLVKSLKVERDQNDNAVGQCEFVNELANPDCNIKIEVVDDSIPDAYKNRVYLANERHVNGRPIKNSVIIEEIDEKDVPDMIAEKNVQDGEINGKVDSIPTVTVTQI